VAIASNALSEFDPNVVVKAFQALSLEAHTKIEVEQQQLISKIEIIQCYFKEASKSLDKIILLEKRLKQQGILFKRQSHVQGTGRCRKF
jgi:hypothetical protein